MAAMAPQPTGHRPVAGCIALIAILGIAACSGDGGGGDTASGADGGANGKAGACKASSTPAVCGGIDGLWSGALSAAVVSGGPKCSSSLAAMAVGEDGWRLCGDGGGLQVDGKLLKADLDKAACKVTFKGAGASGRKWTYAFETAGSGLNATVEVVGNFCPEKINNVCVITNCHLRWQGTLSKCPDTGCPKPTEPTPSDTCAVESAAAKPGDVVWSRTLPPSTGGAARFGPSDVDEAGNVVIAGTFDGPNFFIEKQAVFEGGKAFALLDGKCGVKWLQSTTGQGLPRVLFNPIGGVDLLGHHEAVFAKTTDPGIDKGWTWLLRWDALRTRKWRADLFDIDWGVSLRRTADGGYLASADGGGPVAVKQVDKDGKIKVLGGFPTGAGKPPWGASVAWHVRPDGSLLGLAAVFDGYPWSFAGQLFKATKGGGRDLFIVAVSADGKLLWHVGVTAKGHVDGLAAVVDEESGAIGGAVVSVRAMAATEVAGIKGELAAGILLLRLNDKGEVGWHRDGLGTHVGQLIALGDGRTRACGAVVSKTSDDLADKGAPVGSAVVAELDGDGKTRWSTTLATKFTGDVVCAAAGKHVVVGGPYTGSVKVGSRTRAAPAQQTASLIVGLRR